MLRSIQPLLHRLESDPRWSQFRLMQTIQRLWPEIVGAAVAKQTSPLRIQRGTLQVATSTGAWAQNLAFQRQLILSKLNPQISTPLKDIRFLPAEWHRSSVSDPGSLEDPRHRTPGQRLRRKPFSPPQTPEEALERWIKRVKQVQRTMTPCPHCGHPCPPEELQRWSTCGFCRLRSPSN